MFEFEPTSIRQSRQERTEKKISEILFNGIFSVDIIKEYINITKFNRLCDRWGDKPKDVFSRCKGDKFTSNWVASCLAKEAHRQSSKDEKWIIESIGEEVENCGVIVKQLSNTQLRPASDGQMYSKKEFDRSGLNKREGLKTIDALITGKVNGYITQKLLVGEGGGQDNVLVEMYDFAKWAIKHGQSDSVYVCLVDTDREQEYNTLKEKYDSDNVWVVNHIELQNRLGISS